jgi:hypothetical protein
VVDGTKSLQKSVIGRNGTPTTDARVHHSSLKGDIKEAASHTTVPTELILRDLKHCDPFVETPEMTSMTGWMDPDEPMSTYRYSQSGD